MNEHPENIAIPPSTDGFWFCAWDAVDGDTAQYRQARAGMIPCPIAGICPTRAAHLALIAERKTSIIWPTLTLRERKRIRSSAQGLLFKAEQQLLCRTAYALFFAPGQRRPDSGRLSLRDQRQVRGAGWARAGNGAGNQPC